MKMNQNIDELLNSYIDGELAKGQQAEVQQLIANELRSGCGSWRLARCWLVVCLAPRLPLRLCSA